MQHATDLVLALHNTLLNHFNGIVRTPQLSIGVQPGMDHTAIRPLTQ